MILLTPRTAVARDWLHCHSYGVPVLPNTSYNILDMTNAGAGGVGDMSEAFEYAPAGCPTVCVNDVNVSVLFGYPRNRDSK